MSGTIGSKFSCAFPVDRGFPVGIGLRLSFREDSSPRSVTYNDLTGWTFGLAFKRVSGETDYPATTQAVDFSATISIADPQSGDTLGVIYITIPSATTGNVEFSGVEYFRADLICTPLDSNPRVIGTFLIRMRDSTTANPDADATTVITPDVIIDGSSVASGETSIHVVEVGPIGGGGSRFLAKGVSVNCKTTGAKDIYVAAGNAVPLGVILRASSIAGVITPPRMHLRRSDGVVMTLEDEIVIENNTMAYHWSPAPQQIPMLSVDQKLQLFVDVAADATTFTVLADVEGYSY